MCPLCWLVPRWLGWRWRAGQGKGCGGHWTRARPGYKYPGCWWLFTQARPGGGHSQAGPGDGGDQATAQTLTLARQAGAKQWPLILGSRGPRGAYPGCLCQAPQPEGQRPRWGWLGGPREMDRKKRGEEEQELGSNASPGKGQGQAQTGNGREEGRGAGRREKGVRTDRAPGAEGRSWRLRCWAGRSHRGVRQAGDTGWGPDVRQPPAPPSQASLPDSASPPTQAPGLGAPQGLSVSQWGQGVCLDHGPPQAPTSVSWPPSD